MITYGIVIAAFIIMQILVASGNISSLLQGLLVPLCVYAIAAVSLNLVVGISGELSLGHAGFMCVGAYASAFFSKAVGEGMPGMVRFILAILVGALVAGIFGIIIGIPVLRLRGDYLAIVTLAFGEIIKNLMNVLYIGVVLILITLFIVLNLIQSRSGRAIMSIRDNRIAAESVGINITKYKLMAFSISAALAGVAGVLYAHNLSTLTVKKFDYNTSILILVFVVLGGIGSIRGSIIAAVILTALPEMLRGLSDYRMLIYAIVLIVMMLFNWAPSAINWRERVKSKLKGKTKKTNKKEAA